ncbi:hypothetical protein K438DRAFT_1781120 [Mycena galopus ATCC 62051]|nr:hypothetical protein K438DRAFT_1781120 [Mycena galopus ATCC 62051]
MTKNIQVPGVEPGISACFTKMTVEDEAEYSASFVVLGFKLERADGDVVEEVHAETESESLTPTSSSFQYQGIAKTKRTQPVTVFTAVKAVPLPVPSRQMFEIVKNGRRKDGSCRHGKGRRPYEDVSKQVENVTLASVAALPCGRREDFYRLTLRSQISSSLPSIKFYTGLTTAFSSKPYHVNRRFAPLPAQSLPANTAQRALDRAAPRLSTTPTEHPIFPDPVHMAPTSNTTSCGVSGSVPERTLEERTLANEHAMVNINAQLMLILAAMKADGAPTPIVPVSVLEL